MAVVNYNRGISRLSRPSGRPLLRSSRSRCARILQQLVGDVTVSTPLDPKEVIRNANFGKAERLGRGDGSAWRDHLELLESLAGYDSARCRGRGRLVTGLGLRALSFLAACRSPD
ncbi:hypothetical protein D9M70_461180 [compost metagenome]